MKRIQARNESARQVGKLTHGHFNLVEWLTFMVQNVTLTDGKSVLPFFLARTTR